MSKRPSISAGLSAGMRAVAVPPPDPLAVAASPQPTKLARAKATPRADMKKLLIPIDPSIHKKLKLLAVEEERTLEDVCRSALSAYLTSRDSK